MRSENTNSESAALTQTSAKQAVGKADVRRVLQSFQQFQFNDYSCSVATVTMLVNSARRLVDHPVDRTVIDQQHLLDRVTACNWAQRVSDAGYKGRHGLPFNDFHQVVMASFNAFGIPFAAIEAVPTPPDATDHVVRRHHLRAALESMATTSRELIAAYFTQGAFIGRWHGHHISPVGAYDPRGRRALILDVDAVRYDPYWVPLKRFYDGLLGRTNIYDNRGGGYIRIRL